MTAFEIMVNKTAYYKGEQLLDERIRKEIPKPSFDEYNNLIEELATGAIEDDGYTELGQLTETEIYFLLVEYADYDTANDYLAEIEYFEVAA